MGAEEEIRGLPLDSAGVQLRRAREALGKTLADIASATKISERLLRAIEAGDYAAMPSRTYVIGFARSYARTVGLNQDAIANEVRSELDAAAPGDERIVAPVFVPGDPARVPGWRVAIIAGLAALAVVAAGLFYWHGSNNSAGALPSILPADAPATAAKPAVSAATAAASSGTTVTPAPAAGGAVVFTAQAPGIWVKVYDAAGKTLLEKQMAMGESFTVPADANGPLIWTGRPDVLDFTVGGRPVAKLSEKQKTMKGVPISAAALLARPVDAATATPVAAQTGSAGPGTAGGASSAKASTASH